MAADGSQARQFDELLSRYEKEIVDAFVEAIEDLKSQAEIQRVIRLLEAGDIAGAMDALHIDEAAFQPVSSAIGRAHQAGGVFGASTMPRRDPDGARLVIRFNGSNSRAEAWLRDHSSTLITRIVDDQRVAIRTHLTEGMAKGQNPRQTALEVVGRVNRASGKREGGVIGLTSPQEGFVRNARAELASDDPAVLRRYLERTRRDKRYDRSILKAIREGRALDPAIAQKAGDRYAARLLQLRGEQLALNESFASLMAGRQEAYRQGVASGKFTAAMVRKTWRHLTIEHPRLQHVAMNGETVGLEEHFVMPDGTRMLYPHDPAAPASHSAGCRCQADYRVDWLSNLPV